MKTAVKTHEEWLTLNEIAEMVKVNYSTVYRWIVELNAVPYTMFTRRVRVLRSDWEEYHRSLRVKREPASTPRQLSVKKSVISDDDELDQLAKKLGLK